MSKRSHLGKHLGGETGRGITRRGFLAGTAGTAAAAAGMSAPYILPRTSLGTPGRAAPGERIGVGFIGMGGRGNDHFRTLLGDRDVQVLAVCDANKPKADKAKEQADAYYAAKTEKAAAGGGCASTSDFREVIAHPGVDAVVIASPENWHALQAAAAVRAGKDVYCEKALSLTVAEGRQLCEAVRRYRRILQVGTQQRSDRNFRHACELARNGYLGKLKRVEVAVPGGRALPNAPPTPPPPGLDYEMWLGPAPFTPHNDIKCSYNWYFISDYCAGWIESWGVHHCDIALWGAPDLLTSPLEVEGKAEFPADGLADTSVKWRVLYRTAGGLICDFSDEGQQPHGVKFIGEDGWVHVWRGGMKSEPEHLVKLTLKPGDLHLYESGSHHGNFLECMKSRRDPVAPVEAGHAATTMTLIGDIATRVGRKCTWDWQAEKFANDEPANRMLSRSMRAPWTM